MNVNFSLSVVYGIMGVGLVFMYEFMHVCTRGLGGVVVIDAAIGAHRRGSCPVHYLTVAATLDKSLTSLSVA